MFATFQTEIKILQKFGRTVRNICREMHNKRNLFQYPAKQNTIARDTLNSWAYILSYLLKIRKRIIITVTVSDLKCACVHINVWWWVVKDTPAIQSTCATNWPGPLRHELGDPRDPQHLTDLIHHNQPDCHRKKRPNSQLHDLRACSARQSIPVRLIDLPVLFENRKPTIKININELFDKGWNLVRMANKT